MSLSPGDLLHGLFADPGVYFPLARDFTFEDFTSLIGILQLKASVKPTAEQIANYWAALKQRMEGKLRWNQIAPFELATDDPASQRRAFLSRHTVQNILSKRPYVGFTIDSITYIIDVFNPRDELHLHYAGAGEPVLVLLLGESQWGKVQMQLVRNEQFYAVLREFIQILNPRIAVGMHPSTLATLMLAYRNKQVDSSVSPWSFFFALSVMKLPKPVGDVALKRYFKCFQRWDQDRILLQVNEGLDADLSTRAADAAKLFGMKYVLELHPEWG
jgi:hypothetical protein